MFFLIALMFGKIGKVLDIVVIFRTGPVLVLLLEKTTSLNDVMNTHALCYLIFNENAFILYIFVILKKNAILS